MKREMVAWMVAATLAGVAGTAGAQEEPDVPEDLRQDQDGSRPRALGAPGERLVYTPVVPCRIIDTRPVGGALPVGTPRDYKVTGPDLSSQGGNPAGCNVPFGTASAAMINFVAVNPVGPGNLRAWAYRTPPGPPPNATVLNYTSGFNIANGIAVPICDPQEAGQLCPSDLRVRADANGTHLVADVVGYFTKEGRTLATVALTTSTALIASTCTHVTGGTITVNATGPGQIVVRGIALAQLGHTAGTADRMILGFAASAANCAFTRLSRAIVPPEAPSATYEYSVPVAHVFNVSTSGPHSFYLNAVMVVGGEGADLVVGSVTQIDATFYPDPPS